MKLSKTALEVLTRRYLQKNEEGKVIETPEEMFRRVANAVAEAEKEYEPDALLKKELSKSWANEFYNLMANLDFLPNSPTLFGAGTKLGQLAACFVLPIDDNMEAIFDAVKYTALIQKSGGGTGFDFSRLRPKNDTVRSTSGISSGPVSFMTVFDSTTETIKQGGKRRGANLATLRCDHPDILEFIACKESNRHTNFNISVAATDKFMEAVRDNNEYDIISPRNKQSIKKLKAREVFQAIVNQAWKHGDPGLIFIDEMNRHNPTPWLGKYESTNPCGEQVLLPNESCNLGSINLVNFIEEHPNLGHFYFNDSRLIKIVPKCIRFLDDVITVNAFPVDQIKKATLLTRKIGLGIMGLADCLALLGIPYNSKKALSFVDEVMSIIQTEAKQASINLAKERGSYPALTGVTLMNDDKTPHLMRNATVTTIAPTGSLSIIANVNSGIEPFFALAFKRNILDGDSFFELSPTVERILSKHPCWKDKDKIIKHIAEHGTLANCEYVPAPLKILFLTSHEIHSKDHIQMQSYFQKHVDNAISKTVNLPNSATKEDVAEAYMFAWRMKCKGITIYRDDSRNKQVLETGHGEKKAIDVKEEEQQETQKPKTPQKRPTKLKGVTTKIETSCGSMYVTVNSDENEDPFEVFTTIGKAGGCASSQNEALGRLISLCLRAKIPPNFIVKQLRSISCHVPCGFGKNKVLSCSDALAKAIGDILQIEKEKNNESHSYHKRGGCPDCGGQIEHESGCAVCKGCGWSEC